MKNKKIWIIVTMCVLMMITSLFTGCDTQKSEAANTNTYSGKKPKYVFLFIGDGMAMPQITAAENYLGKLKNTNTPENSKLTFTQFPSQGMATTYDAGSFITDSASAGTAIASGNKTLTGVINMDKDKTKKFTSIAEMAKKEGMKIGIVSSVSLDHATPASFYAHQPTRSNYYDIELELGKSDFNYFAGGGFLASTGKNKDKSDAFEEAKKNGYKVINSKSGFTKLNSKSDKVIAVSPVLDNEKALPYAINKNTEGISLAEFTQKGIEVLDNDKGFFMMIEGGKVDWAGHANDAATSIKEVISYDESIQKAKDFYNKHKDETLIIVTGDHETGGLGIGFAGTDYSTFFDKLSKQSISYDEFTKKVEDYRKNGHTPENAKIEDLLPIIKQYYGLEAMDAATYNDLYKKATDSKSPDKDAASKIGMALSPKDMDDLKTALSQSMLESSERSKDEQAKLLYGGYDPLTMTLTHIMAHKAGVGFTSYAHTGVPVPVFAIGKGQEIFNGYYDNTDIFKKMTSILDLKTE